MGLANLAFQTVPPAARYRGLALLHRFREPEIRACRDNLHGGTAIDVGGWYGPWTYRLAQQADRVVTFEPVPHVAEFLRSVVPENVTVVEAAASDTAGRCTIWVPTTGAGSEGRTSINGAINGTKPIEVDSVRLDDMHLSDVRLVKIDVEGHELSVLDGASYLIERDHPVLIIELEQRFHTVHLNTIFEMINNRGYSGWFLDGGQWRSVADFDVDRWQGKYQAAVDRSGYITSMRFRRNYKNNFLFRHQ